LTPPNSEGGGRHRGELDEDVRGWVAGEGGRKEGRHKGTENRRRERREGGDDVFLLQIYGRQIVHVYQMSKTEQFKISEKYSTIKDREGHTNTTEGNGDTGGVVEGMVVGEELEDRDMFTAMLRAGDTLYIPRGWVYETTTNTSFLDVASMHVTVLAHVSALSWETVLHAAIKVVAEEEESSNSIFLPLLSELADAVSHLLGGGGRGGGVGEGGGGGGGGDGGGVERTGGRDGPVLKKAAAASISKEPDLFYRLASHSPSPIELLYSFSLPKNLSLRIMHPFVVCGRAPCDRAIIPFRRGGKFF